VSFDLTKGYAADGWRLTVGPSELHKGGWVAMVRVGENCFYDTAHATTAPHAVLLCLASHIGRLRRYLEAAQMMMPSLEAGPAALRVTQGMLALLQGVGEPPIEVVEIPPRLEKG
jgi:hypothetical protein